MTRHDPDLRRVDPVWGDGIPSRSPPHLIDMGDRALLFAQVVMKACKSRAMCDIQSAHAHHFEYVRRLTTDDPRRQSADLHLDVLRELT